MTDPYASIAAHYDIMIDWPARLARERSFFERLFRTRPVRHVLDIGCGTGHHSRLFATLDATVIGLDPSRPMLERARALTSGDNPRFIEGGFAEIPTLPGVFDFIAVLGNTLAYVADYAELVEVLRHMRAALAPDGRLCLQTINYDSLLTAGDRWLPLINRQVDGQEYLFLREYRRAGRHVEFTLISLHHAEGWQQTVERSRHYPITGQRLRRALRQAGFAQVTCYGDYRSTPYVPAESPSLVVLAQGG